MGNAAQRYAKKEEGGPSEPNQTGLMERLVVAAESFVGDFVSAYTMRYRCGIVANMFISIVSFKLTRRKLTRLVPPSPSPPSPSPPSLSASVGPNLRPSSRRMRMSRMSRALCGSAAAPPLPNCVEDLKRFLRSLLFCSRYHYACAFLALRSRCSFARGSAPK